MWELQRREGLEVQKIYATYKLLQLYGMLIIDLLK